MDAWKVRRLNPEDPDLTHIVEQINTAAMEINEPFTTESLTRFLEDPSAIYLTIHDGEELAGTLHGFLHRHPAGKTYVYVDELDTDRAYRRRGVATALMKAIKELTRDLGAAGFWLGTDDWRADANALYRSLAPSVVEPGAIYSWDLEQPPTGPGGL